MSAGPFRAKILLPCIVLVAGILGLVTVTSSVADLGLQPYQASTASTVCIIPVQSSLTVNVVDAKGSPVSGAIVLLNGTYLCGNTVYSSNFSGKTDADGNAAFAVVPYTKYNVTVIPPSTFAGASLVVSQITAPNPTMFSTTTIAIPEFPVSSMLAYVAAFLLIAIMAEKRKAGHNRQ